MKKQNQDVTAAHSNIARCLAVKTSFDIALQRNYLTGRTIAYSRVCLQFLQMRKADYSYICIHGHGRNFSVLHITGMVTLIANLFLQQLPFPMTYDIIPSMLSDNKILLLNFSIWKGSMSNLPPALEIGRLQPNQRMTIVITCEGSIPVTDDGM